MRIVVAVSLVVGFSACSGGGDSTGTSSGTGTDGGGGGGGSTSSSSGSTSAEGRGGSSSGTTSSSSSGAGGCPGGTMTVLVKYGQTSSCSHPIPAGVDRDNMNVYYSPSPGVLEKLCKTDRTSCEQWKGWFELGDEIGFCDETCAKIDEGPDSTFLVETGCPITSCF